MSNTDMTASMNSLVASPKDDGDNTDLVQRWNDLEASAHLLSPQDAYKRAKYLLKLALVSNTTVAWQRMVGTSLPSLAFVRDVCCQWASHFGRLDILKYLFENRLWSMKRTGGSNNRQFGSLLTRCVTMAGSTGHLDVVRYLCDRAVDHDDGLDAEIIVRWMIRICMMNNDKNMDLAKLIAMSGAFVIDAKRLYQLLTSNGCLNIPIGQFLLEMSAHQLSFRGYEPLTRAVEEDNIAVVCSLLSSKEEVNNNWNVRAGRCVALQKAMSRNHRVIVDKLLAHDNNSNGTVDIGMGRDSILACVVRRGDLKHLERIFQRQPRCDTVLPWQVMLVAMRAKHYHLFPTLLPRVHDIKDFLHKIVCRGDANVLKLLWRSEKTKWIFDNIDRRELLLLATCNGQLSVVQFMMRKMGFFFNCPIPQETLEALVLAKTVGMLKFLNNNAGTHVQRYPLVTLSAEFCKKHENVLTPQYRERLGEDVVRFEGMNVFHPVNGSDDVPPVPRPTTGMCLIMRDAIAHGEKYVMCTSAGEHVYKYSSYSSFVKSCPQMMGRCLATCEPPMDSTVYINMNE
jgi:hypothetical protein